MKKIKQWLTNRLFSRKRVKELCYLSAMIGYKYTCDWIIKNVEEAGVLIGEYRERHPREYQEIFTEYLKDPDYILDKAEKRLKQLDTLEEGGYDANDIDELKFLGR